MCVGSRAISILQKLRYATIFFASDLRNSYPTSKSPKQLEWWEKISVHPSSSCPLPASYPHTSDFYALFNQSNNTLCCPSINSVEIFPDKRFSVPCQTSIITQELFYGWFEVFWPVNAAGDALLDIIPNVRLATKVHYDQRPLERNCFKPCC